MSDITITDGQGQAVEDPDLSRGWVERVCDVADDGTLVTTALVYHEYSEAELADIAEREERERVLAEAAAFFPAGREEMEAEISSAAAGADPALATFATLAMPTVAPTARDSELAPVLKWAPAYVPEGHDYKAGEVFVTEDGSLWRVSQDFTSQAQWAPGDEGLDALFYRIEVAPDGVIVWAQPHGAYDAVAKGDLRHWPDADGPVYRSLVEGNAYSPEAYPAGWELVE